MERNGHVALVGPTASGKSALALAVARARPDRVELVVVDSMQVYRGMDVGTAKPTPVEQAEVPHHLLDLVEPDDDYTVARFVDDARAALDDIATRGRQALLVAGTPLYLRAVVDDLDIPGRWPDVRAGLDAEVAADPDATPRLHARLAELDPVAAGRIEPTDARRVVRAMEVTVGGGRPFSSYGPGLGTHPPSPITLVGIDRPAAELDARIAARFDAQLAAGFLDEVRALGGRPAGLSRTARQALGYKELLAHLEDPAGTPLADAVDLAVRRTRRFARRQRAWFGKDPRTTWLADAGDPELLGRIVDAAAD